MTQRIPVLGDEQGFSPITRAFLNHRRAWERAARTAGLSLIVEADFVPCRGFGSFALPIPESETHRAVAWLYLCGGRFRRKIEEQFFVGSSVSVVAYVVSPLVARYLLEFADQSLATIDPRQWYAFDGYVWQFLDERGIPTFIPFRNYGEHGGWMSPGHRQEGRKLLPHRAECLMGPLHFLPFYARGRTGRFLVVRFLHKLEASAKFVCGKTVTPQALRELGSNRERADLVATGLRRLLSPY